ncbi:MAG: hypothetical protein GAK31_03492 [Stenotrophomonas maltophilia]|uniref:Intracellular growth attenuator family protein n=1 Tax=Stenotrophomonas maltophilia TaxID=40324 RepID=A0A7V8FDS6_STEMA|nr:MAG: hypothetical protein GAK31_03492 [Stenotrophomonas maltophilia]
MNVAGVLLTLLAALPAVVDHLARWEARRAFKVLAEQAPVRVLSKDEDAALEPFRTALDVGRDNGVRLLDGPCIEHRWWMRRGVRSAWRSLGGVKVLLPFNALEHVGADNRAEVVLGRRFAVIVRMGGFDLATAGTRTLRTAATQISERSETEEEQAQRRRPGTPWWAIGLALAAGICGVLPRLDLGRWSWIALAFGLVLGVAAFVLYRRRHVGTPVRQPVVRVRGRLSVLQFADPHEGATRHNAMLLGNGQRLVIDPAWLESGAITPGRWLDAEVRAHDRRLLSLGPDWSLPADVQRFPSVPVTRHLLMFLVAAVSLLLVFLSGDGLRIEAARAAQLLGPAQLPTDTLPGTLQDHPPAPGDGLRLTVDATCELVTREHAGHALAVPDCSRLRWGGAPLEVPPLAVAESILRLGAGDTLRVHWEPADGLFPAYQRVSGLHALRRELDAACAEGLRGCDDLRAQLAAVSPDDSAVLARWTITAIKVALNEAARAPVVAAWAASTPALLAAQQGGVVLVDAGSRLEPDSTGLALGDAGAAWKTMRNAATQAKRITCSGTLQSHSTDGRTLWLDVDRTRPANAAIGGLAYCLWLIGASLLALVQGILLIRAVPRALSRLGAFAEALRERPPPRASWPA